MSLNRGRKSTGACFQRSSRFSRRRCSSGKRPSGGYDCTPRSPAKSKVFSPGLKVQQHPPDQRGRKQARAVRSGGVPMAFFPPPEPAANWCGWAKQGDEVAWYRDKFTGTAMERPGLDRLLADARGGKLTRVCVWRLDRLERTARGLLTLLDELQGLNVGFVSLREGFDLATPAGRLMAGVLGGDDIGPLGTYGGRRADGAGRTG